MPQMICAISQTSVHVRIYTYDYICDIYVYEPVYINTINTYMNVGRCIWFRSSGPCGGACFPASSGLCPETKPTCDANFGKPPLSEMYCKSPMVEEINPAARNVYM